MLGISFASTPILLANLLCLIAAVGIVLKKANILEWLAPRAVQIAFVALTVAILQSWITTGKPPFQTIYETMIFGTWCVMVAYLLFTLMYKIDFLAPIVGLAGLCTLLYAVMNPDTEVMQLSAALRSPWFIPHVVTYFIAYGLVTLGMLASVYSLISKSEERQDSARILSFSATHIGFCFLTLGLITGAIWGKYAWGDYWNWDPKENWALITWLAYLVTIHAYYMRAWRQKRFAWLSIAAFSLVVFTYIGVQNLPTADQSVHTYKQAEYKG